MNAQGKRRVRWLAWRHDGGMRLNCVCIHGYVHRLCGRATSMEVAVWGCGRTSVSWPSSPSL